ncbi:hypothetical protein [Actinophytocola oryzae]|uniref:Uncharacterized protein n=1 Tax=Actinophytocola oryzae TaxID=502181 RepID=A0A4R7UW02_9PSEU|nr:hypothetical protein [Actinophytocola oryzae]TDV40122.1 hypothetical protein CLV71_124141 [Actinophytocola oryzae]
MSITLPSIAPCLPDCEYTADRERDLADPCEAGHTCTVYVDTVEQMETGAQPIVINLVRWLGADGTIDATRVEMWNSDGTPVGMNAFTAAGAASLATALNRASELAGDAR